MVSRGHRNLTIVSGLLGLALVTAVNFVVNMEPAVGYSAQATGVRQLAKQEENRLEGLQGAQPFIDLHSGSFDGYYKRVDKLKQSAIRLHEEANDLDNKAHQYFEQALVFGYFTN